MPIGEEDDMLVDRALSGWGRAISSTCVPSTSKSQQWRDQEKLCHAKGAEHQIDADGLMDDTFFSSDARMHLFHSGKS
jgi:hypothetical protein